jgi:hypothetical protein
MTRKTYQTPKIHGHCLDFQVGSNTTYLTTECLTIHTSLFSGGFAVKPNPIDFDYVFANADFMKNPTLYISEIIIGLLYIVTAVWARRKDRRDVEKVRKTAVNSTGSGCLNHNCQCNLGISFTTFKIS